MYGFLIVLFFILGIFLGWEWCASSEEIEKEMREEWQDGYEAGKDDAFVDMLKSEYDIKEEEE